MRQLPLAPPLLFLCLHAVVFPHEGLVAIAGVLSRVKPPHERATATSEETTPATAQVGLIVGVKFGKDVATTTAILSKKCSKIDE